MTSADRIPPETVRLRPETLNERLTRYEILRDVGHGSMGLVYEARQQGMGRRVAVKVLPPHLALRERTVRRFLREAASMGRLSHPRIVDIYEVESDGDLHFFAMRFVEGPPLDKVLMAGPLAIQDVIRIGRDVSGALMHAHGRGVMHRDIKPANLLRDGEHVVLTDFGLARPLDGKETGTMTESGDLVGTPLYMAPEQIAGDIERIDGRCDVWGLGVTLYELLVQRTPFRGPSAQSILNSILQKEPPLLRRQRDDVPPDLEAIIFKCLEKDPTRRYSGAAALLEDLDALAEQRPVSARTPRFFDPGLRWLRRHPVESFVALGLVATIALFARSAQESSRALDTVRDELSNTQTVSRQAREEVDRIQDQREISHAREQILEARNLWAQGDERDRRKAQNSIEFLLGAYPFESHPDVALAAMETYASWMHAQGRDEEVTELFEAIVPTEDEAGGVRSGASHALQAAMLAGLERFREALAMHRERARRAPRDPGPFLDAGRILRRWAEGQGERVPPGNRTGKLQAALQFHASALDLAVFVGERELIAEILIERASCWLELGRREEAQIDLEEALENDDARADARALLFAAEREATELEILTPTLAAHGGLEAGAEPPLTIEPIQLDTRDLKSAGEGIRVLFQGLGELLGRPLDGDGPEEDSEPGPPADG